MASKRLTRCDYLVLTYKYSNSEQAFYPTIIGRVASGQDMRIRGYVGKQSGKVFVGENGDRVLVQATGASAHDVLGWRDWRMADGISIARMDVQLTLKVNDPDAVIIGTRPHKLYRSTLMYGLNHEGATLYVGAPTSRVRVRIYNKTAEAGITADDGTKLLRIECQYRNEYADRALLYYASGELDSYFLYHVKKMGDAYITNMVSAALEHPDGQVFHVKQGDDDWLARRWEWLRSSVRPAITRLAASDRDRVLDWLDELKRDIIDGDASGNVEA